MEVFELGIKSNLSENYRNLQQCVAVASLFDGKGSSLLSSEFCACPIDSQPIYSNQNQPITLDIAERNALSSTINRLYQLKVGTSVQAQEYEVRKRFTSH
jgi:hypothetical protein